MRGPRRYQLSVSAKQLEVLQGTVDRALDVTRAKQKAQTEGRWAAMSSLKGTGILSTVSPNSIIKRRPIDMRVPHLVKKRPSGRSNWPKSPEEWAQLAARTAERKRMGLSRWMTDRTGLGQMSTSSAPQDDPYVPSDSEREAFVALTSELSMRIGADVLKPTAQAAMVADDAGSDWVKARHGGRRVEVAFESGTTAPQFSTRGGELLAPLPALAVGEVLVFDRAQMYRQQAGDWRMTVTFETS